MQDLDFEDLQATWEKLAEEDPLWAILSVPSKKGGKWDLREFFAEGITEVQHVLQKVNSLHSLSLNNALDFGCGVGRLTQALANHFQHVFGIDISGTMIERAKRLNRHGDKVEYIRNPHDDLALLQDESVDFVYSNLVLQHMKPMYAVRYIKEFFRITKRNGVIVFQIPSHFNDEYLPSKSTDAPLCAAACRGQIRFISGPATLNAGQAAVFNFEVTNLSGEEWLQGAMHSLNLGNHWLSGDCRRLIANDDGRSRLPGRLGPGERATISIEVKAPDRPGKYCLELDVVQEGVRWFKDAGSLTLVLPIQVEGSIIKWLWCGPKLAPAVSTIFMMQGIPKHEILALIQSANVELLVAEEHVTEWYSYKYYMVRR